MQQDRLSLSGSLGDQALDQRAANAMILLPGIDLDQGQEDICRPLFNRQHPDIPSIQRDDAGIPGIEGLVIACLLLALIPAPGLLDVRLHRRRVEPEEKRKVLGRGRTKSDPTGCSALGTHA